MAGEVVDPVEMLRRLVAFDTTSRMTGAFRDDSRTRREFLAMIGTPGQTGLGNV